MRSRKLQVGVAVAASAIVALVATALATGAAGSSQATPVGFGQGLGDEERVRARHRQEGNGRADQDGRHRHGHPGRRLLDDRQGRRRLLQVRQRQRRHQRPPDQVHALHGAAQPGAAAHAGEEADRERQGRRRRRQHELHRVRRQLEVLQVQGLHRDRRRRAGGVLRHAEHRRDEHGPALQRHRRRADPRQARGEVARHRVAGDGRRVLGRRCRQGREGRRDPVQELPDQAPRHRRQLGHPAARAGGR